MLAYILKDSAKYGVEAKQVLDLSPATVERLVADGVAVVESPKGEAFKKKVAKKKSAKS